MKQFFVLGVFVLLAACASVPWNQSQQWKAAESNYFESETACADLKRSGGLKTHYAVAQCIAQRSQEQLTAASPLPQAVQSYMIDIKQIGIQVDKKQRTAEEASIDKDRAWMAMQSAIDAKVQAIRSASGTSSGFFSNLGNQIQANAISTAIGRITGAIYR